MHASDQAVWIDVLKSVGKRERPLVRSAVPGACVMYVASGGLPQAPCAVAGAW